MKPRGEPEQVRLLAARSQFGYVEDPHRAMLGEPEAVDAAYQRVLTRKAERRRLELLAAKNGNGRFPWETPRARNGNGHRLPSRHK